MCLCAGPDQAGHDGGDRSAHGRGRVRVAAAGGQGGKLQLAVSSNMISAVKRSIGSTTGCTITEKASTRAFSWLKAPTSAFTFKTLLRHYAKQALIPQ